MTFYITHIAPYPAVCLLIASNLVLLQFKSSLIQVFVLRQGQERVETSNEQRLPLKKRHYHISTAAACLQPTSCLPQADSMVTAVDCTKKALERTTAQEKDKLPSTGSVGIAGKGQGKPTADRPVIVRDKSGCGSGSGGGSTGYVNSGEMKSKPIVDLPRNSIDEAIEACITRYTATSPPVEISAPSVHSVIATPKKRHRLETAAVAGLMGRSSCTSVSKSKDSASDSGAVNSNKMSGAAVATPPPSKRTVSRSASANSGSVVALSGDSLVSPDPIKTSLAPDSSVGVSSEATADLVTLVSPAVKVSSSVSKVTSSCKVSPPVNKVASQTHKASSPTNKTSVSVSKSLSPVSKPSVVTSSKVSSPTKVTAANSKVSSSPSTKVSVSSPSKVTTSVTSSTTRLLSTSGSKGLSQSTKVTSPVSKTLVPGLKATSPKVFAVSSKASSFPSTVMTVSSATVTTTTTTAATMAATAVVSAATTTITAVSVTAVDEMMLSSRLAAMPTQHNLRLKRANRTSEKDESNLRRGVVGRKKKLIREIRVHVTKLSPSDFLLKKAVGVVKQRVRRRKAINRTGFPIKKKKKKQCASGDTKLLKCLNSVPIPTPLSTPVISIDVKKSLADSSTAKTPAQNSVSKEILNCADTKRPHNLSRKDRSSRISESNPKDRGVEKESKVKGEPEKKQIETVRQTVNGKRDAVKLPLESIYVKEKKEHLDTPREEKDSNSNKASSIQVVMEDAQCSETKESQVSSKQSKGSVVDSGIDQLKPTDSCSLMSPAAEPGLTVASGQAFDTGDKDSRARNKRKRDGSKDDCPLPLGSKRMKKCRDEDMDQDDR